MAERWVVNASPLIVLARIGRDDLFFMLADQVVMPRVVAQEIQAGPKDAARHHSVGETKRANRFGGPRVALFACPWVSD